MANKIPRTITNINKIDDQPFETNNQNDTLSDKDFEIKIRTHNKNTKEGMYHGLTDNIKSINNEHYPNTKEEGNNVTYKPRWGDEVIQKPFERLSTDFEVDDGTLYVNIDNSTITRASNGKLQAPNTGSGGTGTTYTWDTLPGKPFNTVNSTDFSVEQNQLKLNNKDYIMFNIDQSGNTVQKYPVTIGTNSNRAYFWAVYHYIGAGTTTTANFTIPTSSLGINKNKFTIAFDQSLSYYRTTKGDSYEFQPIICEYSSTNYSRLKATQSIDNTSDPIVEWECVHINPTTLRNYTRECCICCVIYLR